MSRILTQGSIINNCIAENYSTNLVIYGLIITPRCDLAHDGKVNSVHYLPIVDFDDWFCCDGISYLWNKWTVKNKEKFIQMCNEYKVPSGLQDYLLYEKIAEKVIVDKSKRLSFINKAKLLFNDDVKKRDFENHYHKSDTQKRLIDNLIKDDLPAYYLIDDWENGRGRPKVVLLRDLKRISYETSQKICKGLNFSDLNKTYDELKYTSDYDVLYQVCTEVNSPFIEHILQRFSHNFCRIGVDDRDSTTAVLLSERLKDI